MRYGSQQLPGADGERLPLGHPGNLDVGRGLRLLLGVCAGTVLLCGARRRAGGCRCPRYLPTDYLDWQQLLRDWPERQHARLPVQLCRQQRKPDSVLRHGDQSVHRYGGTRPIVPAGIAAVCILPLREQLRWQPRFRLDWTVHGLPALTGPTTQACDGQVQSRWSCRGQRNTRASAGSSGKNCRKTSSLLWKASVFEYVLY